MRNIMKLEIYDNVKLNTELPELSEEGIHKGCRGLILDIQADRYFIYCRQVFYIF